MMRAILLNVSVFFRLLDKPQYVVVNCPSQPSPQTVKKSELVLVGEVGHPKWVCFHCPGECKTFYRLPLNKMQTPHWKLTVDFLGRPTAFPSVHQKSACNAHFWIKKGAVDWCSDSLCGPNNKYI